MSVDLAWSAPAVVTGEEAAVIQAMAATINQETTRPFERLYFESEFSAVPHVKSSIENPDRKAFCGLTREKALEMVAELENVNYRAVEFDKVIAESAGLKLGHKKNPRFPYVILSRVFFDPAKQHAWVAVELNGSAGAVMRFDKIAGEWKKTSRCGGWLKAEE